jgi:RNA polymerase sigma-70 factor (ECF subfamily)
MEVSLTTSTESTSDSRTRDTWLAGCETAYPGVYRALIAIGAAPHDAADALQDAFEDALRQHGKLDRPEGWLFVVALRKWRRARWRRRIFQPLEFVSSRGVTKDSDESIDLLKELSRLSERQRTVMVARYVLGLTQREIAALLGVAPGTVAATVHQSTTLLRERLLGGQQ